MPAHKSDNKIRRRARLPQLGKHNRRNWKDSEFVTIARASDEAQAIARAFREARGEW